MTLDAQEPQLQELWTSGEGGYHTYRIPALCVTRQGTLLAFCEGRKNSSHDADEIDLLLRRSEDGGSTWSETQVVVSDPGTTCGNPAPVVDRDTGIIWLPFNKNPAGCTMADLRSGAAARTVWLTNSADDGVTWSDPVEITPAVKRPDWTWYATGPCHSIQLRSGRLLVPCDHRARLAALPDAAGALAAPVTLTTSAESGADAQFEPRYSHVIYSDDHGITWRIGGIVSEEGGNECTALETSDGEVYLNCRDQGKRHHRMTAWSRDGGETFPEVAFDQTLIEPACQGSVERLTIAGTHDKNRVLFCNPASTTRDTLTVRLSYDEGRTWQHSKVIEAGRASYSDLAVISAGTDDQSIWCLYERGDQSPYERLTLARFTLAWLTDGLDRTS